MNGAGPSAATATGRADSGAINDGCRRWRRNASAAGDALHRLQAAFPSENAPIRTALVTARSAPAHKRVILTLRHWDVRIDEALFLGGRPKGPFLEAFGADIFFDDSVQNVESARQHVATAHVPRRGS